MAGPQEEAPREAGRLIRWKNRLLAMGFDPYSAVQIGATKLGLGCVGTYMGDWLKMVATGKPKRRKASDRERWLAIGHPRDGKPGHRSEAA